MSCHGCSPGPMDLDGTCSLARPFSLISFAFTPHPASSAPMISTISGSIDDVGRGGRIHFKGQFRLSLWERRRSSRPSGSRKALEIRGVRYMPIIKMLSHSKHLTTQGNNSMHTVARVASKNLFLYRLPSAVKSLEEKIDKP